MQRHDRDRSANQNPPSIGRVEDYTTPFLVTFGVLIFMGLYALLGLIGLPLTITLAYLVDRFLLTR